MRCVPISAKQREQEWNISRKELMVVEIGILSEAEVEQIISSDFNPVRFFRL
jgi:lycopene cyclase CruP